MSDKYILNNKGNPVLCEDLIIWAKWIESNPDAKILGKTDLQELGFVSTVFLGLDHSFGGPEPILYETMIFGGKHADYQEKYVTKQEALDGHIKAIKIVMGIYNANNE